jgi:hypothetical protein
MFTSTPMMAYEAEIIKSVKEFTTTVGAKPCIEVLETLLLDWISSESSDDTPSEYRAHVVSCYLEMRKLMEKVTVRAEVSHD